MILQIRDKVSTVIGHVFTIGVVLAMILAVVSFNQQQPLAGLILVAMAGLSAVLSWAFLAHARSVVVIESTQIRRTGPLGWQLIESPGLQATLLTSGAGQLVLCLSPAAPDLSSTRVGRAIRLSHLASGVADRTASILVPLALASESEARRWVAQR